MWRDRILYKDKQKHLYVDFVFTHFSFSTRSEILPSSTPTPTPTSTWVGFCINSILSHHPPSTPPTNQTGSQTLMSTETSIPISTATSIVSSSLTWTWPCSATACSCFYCQAQFQLASPVPVELRLSLSLIITIPTHPHTRESRDAAWNWPYMVSR